MCSASIVQRHVPNIGRGMLREFPEAGDGGGEVGVGRWGGEIGSEG